MPGAMTFTGPRDVLAFREALESLEPGRRHRIAFVAARASAWTLPLYELALQTAEHGRRRGLELHLEVVTREADPLDVFGPDASAAVARRLISSGVHLRTATFAQEFDDGQLWLELEGPLEADLAVALPRLHGPHLPGLPATPTASCPVDAYGRVPRLDRRMGGGRHDHARLQAGRSRGTAGRRRRRGHRRRGRRPRPRGGAVPAGPMGHAC